MSDDKLSNDDIYSVAETIDIKITLKEVNTILDEYKEASEKDPSATWNLVVENQIYEIYGNRTLYGPIKFLTNVDIVTFGVLLGLKFNQKTNYEAAYKKGRVVFDGINGQRFSVELSWGDEEIIKSLGRAVLLMGYRQKAVELHSTLSIMSDNIQI
jgi:hypothetical protein